MKRKHFNCLLSNQYYSVLLLNGQYPGRALMLFCILFLLKKSYRVIFFLISRECIQMATAVHSFEELQNPVYSLELCSCFRVVWHSCEKKSQIALACSQQKWYQKTQQQKLCHILIPALLLSHSVTLVRPWCLQLLHQIRNRSTSGGQVAENADTKEPLSL